MEIKYISGTGSITIDLTRWPYAMYEGSNLIDYQWAFDSVSNYQRPGGKVTRFKRPITTRKVPIDVMATTAMTYIAAVNYLHNIFERDVVNGTPGKLYFNDCYILCYFTGSTKSEWEGPAEYQENVLTLTVLYPLWVKETVKNFVSGGDGGGHFFPYDYPYDYVNSYTLSSFMNSHFATSDCEIAIYGPCINPSIIIGGSTYDVTADLAAGEKLLINTRDKTIIKYSSTGVQTNLFNSRSRLTYCFNPVQVGSNSVSWSGDFTFTVTLFSERSEPEWT